VYFYRRCFKINSKLRFLPRDAIYALRGLSHRNSVHLSIRSSVPLSVTLVDCVHKLRPTIMISSPYGRLGSPIILVFIGLSRHSKGVIPSDGVEWGWGFWRFSTFKSPYLRNGARYDKGYYWSLIGNRIRAFDWYQNRWPWLTLKWHWTAFMHSVALHTCFSEPTTKIWMKIDPHYQRQKCSPDILVSSMVSFMRIFVGVRRRGGVKLEVSGQMPPGHLPPGTYAVIFYLISTHILAVAYYLQHVGKLWIHFYLVLSLHGTPVNNSIKLNILTYIASN